MKYIGWITEESCNNDINQLNQTLGYPNDSGCETAIAAAVMGAVWVSAVPDDFPPDWLPHKNRLTKPEAESLGAVFPVETM